MFRAATAEALADLRQDAIAWRALHYVFTTALTTTARRVPKYFLARKLELDADIFL